MAKVLEKERFEDDSARWGFRAKAGEGRDTYALLATLAVSRLGGTKMLVRDVRLVIRQHSKSLRFTLAGRRDDLVQALPIELLPHKLLGKGSIW